MWKLFKNSFKITNNCIILATPLIIFLSILGWYFHYALICIDTIPKLILGVVTLLVMASGCSAAWFYMVKKTLRLVDKTFVFEKDRARAFRELLLSLPKGIGRLFLPFLGILSFSCVIYGLFLCFITFLVAKYVGTIDTDLLDPSNLLLSSKELIEEIMDLSQNEILVINCWYILNLCGSIILAFLGLLWIPEVVYSQKNPFKALLASIKKIITEFKTVLFLFIYINLLLLLSSILNTILMFYPVTYFIVLLLYYYLIVYIVVLLFTYYEQSFLKSE